jgi:hypothetical protein
MKNRRHVCNARDAGYIEYPGLLGKVKTGCILTPEYKSRYCYKHRIKACNFEKDITPLVQDEDELGNGIFYMFCWATILHANSIP